MNYLPGAVKGNAKIAKIVHQVAYEPYSVMSSNTVNAHNFVLRKTVNLSDWSGAK